MERKRLLFLLLSFFACFALFSQTLYWVGGNGNFNDPRHWSLVSGGDPANTAPGPNSDLIFDGSGNGPELRIGFSSRAEVRSVTIQTPRKVNFVKTLSPARLVIKNRLDNVLSDMNFHSEVVLEFSNDGTAEGYINTGMLKQGADVMISAGKWRINQLNLDAAHGLYITRADVNFVHSFIEVGRLDLYDCGFLNFDHNILKVVNETKVRNSSRYSFKKAYMNGKIYDDSKPNDGLEAIVSKKGSPNQASSLCVPTPTIIKPTCSPGCDGSVIITLPAASCYTPAATLPYNILITNFGCPGNPSSLLGVGPGTYTLTGFCYCTYGLYVDDFVGNNLETFAIAVPNPVILTTASGTTSLNCGGTCTGSVNINNFNGDAPYQFTVTPPGGSPQYTASSAGPLSVTNLCVGTLTVLINDQNQCINVFNRTFTAPPVLVTNSVAANIACNSVCSGSMTISPAGGTPNYTVNFSTGASALLVSGGTASVTGLCPGPISATLTDTKGCTVTANASIVQPPAITVTASQASVSCFGACTGSASILVSGGVGPYTVTLTPTSGPTSTFTSPGSVNAQSLCAGVYTVTIGDNNNCFTIHTFTLAEPPAFTAAATSTNVSCSGAGCDGAIAITASGGNGLPYSYTWSPPPPSGQGTPTITNLCPGPYTVNLTDGLNCTTSTVVTITQPPALTLTAASQTISCFGSCNASATITASGGNGAPYSYTWSPAPPSGQGTAVISNLCGGTSFTATVSDASLCISTITIGVAQASSITPNISSSSITCSGFCNGSITASPTGTATFNYTLVSSAGTTVTGLPPFTNLCAATYTLLIRNMSTSCVQSFTTTLLEPNPLMGSIVSTSISCFNQCNGTLAGNVVGGTPGYTLTWTSSAGGPTVAPTLTNRCAGTYSLIITDANGCPSNMATATLLQPSDFTITINPTNVNCFSDCNGALAANISGATPSYTLAWSNGWPLNPATNLCVGDYSLTVTDAQGCARTVSASVTAPSSVTINQFTTDVSCSGGANGSATLIASGGTPGYIYQFNTSPVTTNTTGIITGLTQGAYLASATDANGCSQFTTFTISAPPLLSAAITGSSNSCNACTGAATVQASGGTPPYISYVWTNSLGVGVGTTPVATALCPGNYTVTITDNSLCTITQTVHIPLSVNITVVAGGTGIQCFGACTGSAVASPSGGNPGPGGYNYSWSPGGQTTQAATNLCAGAYVVTVSDQLGCSNTATYNVTQPASLTAVASQTNATCSGTCNGVIVTTVTGGTAPISYTWTPGNIHTSSLTNVCAGTYTLQIRDANLCTLSLPAFTITENAPITATLVTTNPNACATNNGSICVTAVSGGSGAGYTYSWSPAVGNSACLTGLTAGSYSVTITDAVSCSNTFPALLTNPTGPTLTVLSQSVNCFGGATGSATAAVAGTGPFSFTWTPAVSSSSNATSSTATGLAAGAYVISSTDGNGCIASQIVNITQASSLTANGIVANISCNAANNGSIVVSPSGGTQPYTYSWSGGLPNSATVTGLSAGVYSLTITDLNLCSAPFTFTVTEPTALTLTSTATHVKCNAACNGSIVVGASGGTGAISYSWSPVGAFTGSTTATVLNLCPNNYVVTAKDLNNCSVSNTITITEPPVLTSTLVLQNASCSNSCNAVAVHQASGGVPAYVFSWSLGPPGSATLSGLCAGNYVGTITDASGCQVVKTFTVIPPAAFGVTLAATSPACNSICSGSIASTATGAQGGITYNWSPAGSGQNPTGLCPGNYNLLAVDANGCEAVASANLVNPPQLTAGLSTTNAACNSNCNGAAVSTPSNATGAVSYTWLPSGPNSPSASNLCPGDYTVHLKDAAGCEVIQTFTLLDPPPLVINPSTNPSTCGQANGVISATASGGTPGYSYNWLAPLSNTNPVVNGLSAGIFTLVVSDANNCTNTVVIPLSNSNGPSFAPVISTSVNCNAQCTGAASVDISGITGGTPSYSVSWLAPAPSAVNPLVNLCAGNYTAQITDANGCILFTGVNILEPPAVILNPSFGVPSCNGTCDGSVSLNPSGGMSPSFSYTWLPSGPNAPVFTSACADTYTILVGDNGCVYTETVTLPAQLNIMASTSVTSNQCSGDCNASASVFNAFGGAPPYTFNWSNGQSGTTATNLCSGTHMVIVTDANGCFNMFPVVIGAASQITTTLAITSPSCGLCNGGSTVTASGGTAPYSYSWTTGSTSTGVSNICAGLYEVLITDNAGCKITETLTINSSSGITGETINIQGLPCAGTCNGAATVTAVGGTAPISYNWISPASNGPVVTNLCSGTYYVQMADAQGCLRTASVEIDPVTTLSLSAFINSPSCGLSDGTIDVLISGGTQPYAINWNPPIGATASVTGVGQGTYTITVTESGPNTCSQSQVINVSNTSGPTVTATQSNIRCFGACTGSITTVVSGTATPFAYNWSTGSNAPGVTNLCKGVVTLSVSDANNCVTINSYTVMDNPLLQSGLPAVNQPSCGLCNGAANLNVFGGTMPYTYTWTNGATTPNTSSLCAGLYQVLITDQLGCQQTETVIINNSIGITGETFTVQGLPCAGTCDASATVTALGGNLPIVYSWISPAVSGSVISNLCDGTYFVQMADAQGCLRTSSVIINPAVSLTLTPVISSPGCGQNNGSINVSISGGTPAYLVSWAPVAGSTPTLNNIGQGTYTITVTESGPNTCSQSQVIGVSNTSGPTVTATQANINCFNACTGSITTVVSGTATPFTYNWSNGSSSSVVTNLCKGVITLTVTDANNCVSISSYTITDNPQIQAGIPTVFQPSCGVCNGSANVNAFGGVFPYTYTWTNGASGPATSGLCAGLYQVLITDQLGCQQTETVIINNSNGITGETFTVQGLPCAGTCDGSATVTALGGNPPIAYSWISPAVSGPVVNNLCDGTYFVQMADAQGCLRTSSVIINPAVTLTLSSVISSPGCGQNNGSINVSISGGTPAYLVSWAPVAGSTPTLNNIGQGTYTITVTESGPNTCTISQQINVSNTSGPTVTATQANINCFNACTGSIATVVSGTATPFTYKWSNGSSSSGVSNLCKGVITLTVTDANNCVSISSYTITDNPQIQAGIPTVFQPSCGLCNGSANVNAFGGVFPYTYTWTTGATGPSVSNLCAGLYQVQITDQLGCQQTETVIINNSNGITGESFNVLGLPCNGTCIGAATVTAVGGNAPVAYTWISPAITGSVISGLCAGTYFVQMTDAQGCIRTSSVDVDAVTTLSLLASVVEPGCQQNNGAITVLISGGTPSYSVVWAPAAGSTPTLSGIGQGSYTITVTESGPNTCTISQQINVSDVNGPDVTATKTDINCFGACSGAVSANVTGTATPFAYNWSIGGTAPAVTNLCSGVITLTVTDANNCVSIETYSIHENPPLQAGVPQVTQPGCNQCNGSALINPLGGTLPYSIVWTTGGAGAGISNLCAGLYQVLITDQLGCQQTENVILNNINGITGETFSVQDEACSNTCSGSATVTAVGGTAPISYNWINPPVANPVAANLCAGTYFVQMTDANGCIRTASTEVVSVPGFTFTPVINKPGCGLTNGSIDVTVTGGLPPYTYTWLPGASSSSVLTGVGPGTYTLLIKDNTSCVKTEVFTISNITAPAITFTQTNIGCFNACTGSISAVATGPASPFTYSWSTGSTSQTAVNLCKGLVTLTATASDGCIAVRSFTLTDSPELELSLPHLVKPGCVGGCDGAVTLIPSGGSLPYTFSWLPSGSGNPGTGLCAGNYSIVITDTKGCTDTAKVLLENPPPIAVTASLINASCSSVADGAINITVSGGTPTYTFSWSGPGAFTSSSQNIGNVPAGTYSLVMSDNGGCSSDTVLTLVPTITITAVAGQDTTLCPAGSVVLSGTNSAGAAQFSWFLLPNNTTPVATTSSITIENAIGTATYELLTVASVSNCVARDTVVVNTFPEIQLDAGPNVLIPVFSTVIIGGSPTAGSPVTFTWSPAFYLNDASSANPVASNTMTTIFTVEVSDANGCRASDTVRVELYPEVKIPNGFSPNADGKNDAWIIDYIDQFPENTVEVYSRWGEQLFYSKGYGTPFNGTYRGKNLPVGTYYYIIHLNHPAYPKPYTGPLTIFR